MVEQGEICNDRQASRAGAGLADCKVWCVMLQSVQSAMRDAWSGECKRCKTRRNAQPAHARGALLRPGWYNFAIPVSPETLLIISFQRRNFCKLSISPCNIPHHNLWVSHSDSVGEAPDPFCDEGPGLVTLPWCHTSHRTLGSDQNSIGSWQASWQGSWQGSWHALRASQMEI